MSIKNITIIAKAVLIQNSQKIITSSISSYSLMGTEHVRVLNNKVDAVIYFKKNGMCIDVRTKSTIEQNEYDVVDSTNVDTEITQIINMIRFLSKYALDKDLSFNDAQLMYNNYKF